MTVYSKFNIIYRLQKWLDSVPGQTFMNYAYSWGASIVILGTLFKLTHLPGANFMLFLGMGTEVVVFFIAAFDRPFDKTADGMELPTHVEDGAAETVAGMVVGAVHGESEEHAFVNGEERFSGGISGGGGGTIIIGGGAAGSGTGVAGGAGAASGTGSEETGEEIPAAAVAGSAMPATGGGTISWVQQQQQVSADLEEATNNYVDELNHLTEMLAKVSEQSQRLTRDSEEMENLNRTLTGICKIYELQLKSASSQMGTIDQINDQTRHMANQIIELNKIYTRMIQAMTINMSGAAAPAAPPVGDSQA